MLDMRPSRRPRLFVTGATGALGRLVIDELLKRVPAESIVAGVRSRGHDLAKQLEAQGVEVRVADYTQPSTLATAFEGIDRLLLISSNAMEERTAQHKNVIDAARYAGVRLVAYTSLLHADRSPLGLADVHRQTEAYLKLSGLPFVLLRHGWYTENHVASIRPALEHAAVMGSAGEGRFSSATRAELAEADAIVLTSAGQAGRVHELAGDESYSLADLAAAISAASGKPVAYKDMLKPDFKAVLTRMGLPESLAELIADADLAAFNGGLEDNSRQLSALLDRPTASWREVVRQAVAAISTEQKTHAGGGD